MLLLFLVIAGGSSSVRRAEAAEESESELSFCLFGPKMKVIIPAEQVTKSDRCPAPVLVQGLRWECTTAEKVDQLVSGFRAQLIELGKKECERYCKEKSPKASCTGLLDVSHSCGLATRGSESIALGRKFGCRKTCSGRAMAFCSLFNGGFTTGDAQVLAGQAPNCHCVPR